MVFQSNFPYVNIILESNRFDSPQLNKRLVMILKHIQCTSFGNALPCIYNEGGGGGQKNLHKIAINKKINFEKHFFQGGVNIFFFKSKIATSKK